MGVQVITGDQGRETRGFWIGTALSRGLNETAQTLLAIATRREEARQRDEALQARVAQAAEALEERKMRRQELGEYRRMQLMFQQQGLLDRKEIAEMNDATRRDIANMNHDARMEALALRESLARLHEANRWDQESRGKPTQLEKLIEDNTLLDLGQKPRWNPNAKPEYLRAALDKQLRTAVTGNEMVLEMIDRFGRGPGQAVPSPGATSAPVAASSPSPPAPTGVTSKGNAWRIEESGVSVVPATPLPSVATTPLVPAITGTPSSSTATTPRDIRIPYPTTRGSR